MMALEGNTSGGGGGGGEQAEQRPRVKKKAWSEEEDLALQRLVRHHGGENWNAVGAGMPGRNAKSCRLRWVQHLDPRVDSVNPFTPREDEYIVHLHGVHGNRWSTIASHLHGRTDNAVKNRWNSVLSKLVRRTPSPSPTPPTPLAGVRARGPSPERHQDQVTAPAPPEVAGTTRKKLMKECLQLFPLAPMDTWEDDEVAAAGRGMHIGADDPLTELRLGPPPPAMVVFDAVPLRAVLMQ